MSAVGSADDRAGCVAEQLARGALRDDPATGDDDEPVGGRLHLVQEVRGEQHGSAASGEVGEQLAHPPHSFGVEAVRRLVEDEDLGVAEQRMGDAEALTHAERVIPDPLLGGARVEPDEREHLLDAPAVDADQLCGQGERFGAAPAAVLGGGIEQDADPASGVREVGEVAAEHRRAAARRPREATQHPQGRRLAGAVGAEEAGDSSGLATKRHIEHGGPASVAFGE